jgi:hypothetical protein
MIETLEAIIHSYNSASWPSFITTLCATKGEGQKRRSLCTPSFENLTCGRRSLMFIGNKSTSWSQRISDNPKCCYVPDQNQTWLQHFQRSFASLRKDYLSFCPAFYLREIIQKPMNGFSWNFVLENFIKISQYNPVLDSSSTGFRTAPRIFMKIAQKQWKLCMKTYMNFCTYLEHN